MEMKKTKKIQINWKLWIGLVFIVGMLLASLTSELWLKRDPYFMEYMRVEIGEDGSTNISKRPFPISETNILGTDIVGRDLFSRLIIGAKMTFLIVFLLTLGKFALSLPLGMLAGGGNKAIARLTENWSFVFTGFPPLFAALFIFSMPFFGIFGDLGFWSHILMMIAVVVLLEWARIALTVKGRTEQIMEEPYIEGAKVLGRKRAGILSHHVLRVIMPDVIVLFVQECARSLMFIGQLAFFGIYFMDTVHVNNEPFPDIVTSLTPEWGAALGESRSFIFSNPLMSFIIVGFIVVTVIAINLIGEGLKESLLHPRPKRQGLLGKILLSGQPVWQRAGVALALLAIVFSAIFIVPNYKATTAVGYEIEGLSEQFKALGERPIGSTEAQEAADLIAAQWQDLGLKPLGDSMFQEKSYPEIHEVMEKTYVTVNSGNDEQKLESGDTFFSFPYTSYGSGEVTAPVEHVNVRQPETLPDHIAQGTYNGKIMAITFNNRNSWQLFRVMSDIMIASMKADVKGIMLIDQSDWARFYFNQRYEQIVNYSAAPQEELRFMPVFYAKAESAELVSNAENMTMSYYAEDVNVVSKNVVTHLGEIDESKRNIIFYTYYDKYVPFWGMESEGDLSAPWIDGVTRIAKVIDSEDVPDYNYYFVAIDGLDGKYYGLEQFREHNPQLINDRTLFIQINFQQGISMFEGTEIDLAAYTFNINSQMDRTAIERSVASAAWTQGIIPFQAMSNRNFPRNVNATLHNLNLVTNKESLFPMVVKFLNNLEMEYEAMEKMKARAQ